MGGFISCQVTFGFIVSFNAWTHYNRQNCPGQMCLKQLICPANIEWRYIVGSVIQNVAISFCNVQNRGILFCEVPVERILEKKAMRKVLTEKLATNYDELFSMISILDSPVFFPGE